MWFLYPYFLSSFLVCNGLAEIEKFLKILEESGSNFAGRRKETVNVLRELFTVPRQSHEKIRTAKVSVSLRL